MGVMHEDARDPLPMRFRAGSVYIYTRDVDGIWQFNSKLVPQSRTPDGYFGRRISIDGQRMAISESLANNGVGRVISPKPMSMAFGTSSRQSI